jgi:hypothetical protein
LRPKAVIAIKHVLDYKLTIKKSHPESAIWSSGGNAMPNPLRASVVFLVLTGQALAGGLPSDGEASFCTRLGRTIGLDEAKLSEAKDGWQASALNFSQRFFFGGGTSMSVGVDLPETATVDDYRRAEGMCTMERRGALCRLVGPINFKMGWKGSNTVTPVMVNEKAIVRIDGNKASCEPSTAN